MKAQSGFPFMDLSLLDRLDQLKVSPVENSLPKRFGLQEVDDKVGCGNHLHRLEGSLHYSMDSSNLLCQIKKVPRLRQQKWIKLLLLMVNFWCNSCNVYQSNTRKVYQNISASSEHNFFLVLAIAGSS